MSDKDNEKKKNENVRKSFHLNTLIPFIQAIADTWDYSIPPPPHHSIHTLHDLPSFCMTLHYGGGWITQLSLHPRMCTLVIYCCINTSTDFQKKNKDYGGAVVIDMSNGSRKNK